jgi:hypothetical protein
MKVRIKIDRGGGSADAEPFVARKVVERTAVGPAMVAFFTMLIALLVGSPVIAQSAVEDRDLKAVQSVIRHQITALKSGDYQSAYSFAAPNVKRAFPSVKNFIAMVQTGYKPLYQHSSYVFGKNTVSKGEVYQELIIADDSRQLWQFIYTLSQQQDKSWKVTNVVMYPFKGKAV